MPADSSSMPDRLFRVLRDGTPAILLTVDENGYPHTAFTFATTADPNRIAIVVDEGSRTMASIERTGQASVQILAPDNVVYLLKGQVHLSQTRLSGSPVPSRRAEIDLVSVKNQAWPEVAVSPLSYDYSAAARTHWEKAVPEIYAELRSM